MKELTASELKSLSHGDTVYRFKNCEDKRFRFVGLMPSSPDYLIFESGEHLTHLYISPKTGEFKDKWFTGEYDSKFIGRLMIDHLESQIESVRQIYFKD